MKIERLELVPFALPFKRPYVTARGRLDRREMVLVRLIADDGLVGLGEAVPLTLRGSSDAASVMTDLKRARRLLEGADGSPSVLFDRCRGLELSGAALAAIDMALMDLLGKSVGQPAWRLLGAELSRPLRCNATLVAGSPDQVAADAADWVSRGFETFKLKVGTDRDEATVSAVREAVGADAVLRIDANGTWDAARAIERLDRLEPQGIELAEQPAATLEDLAAVHAASEVPIAADESVATAADADRAVQLQACDYVTVKLAKVGGSVAARNIAATLPTYLSSALDGPLGIAAAAHVAQVIPDVGLAHGLATQILFSEWPAISAARLEGSALTPPDAPGLGVELDEQALSDLAFDVS